MISEGLAVTPQENDVTAAVRKLVLHYSPSEKPLVANSQPFVDALEYHSLALLELSLAIEDEFTLEPLEPEDVEHVETIDELATVVLKKLTQKDDQ